MIGRYLFASLPALVGLVWGSVASAQSGIIPFTPYVGQGVSYGAGGQALPTLNNPHIYTCTSGDNAPGLQAALKAPGDVLVEGAQCTVDSTVDFPSNKQLQCRDSATILYDPATTNAGLCSGAPGDVCGAMFYFSEGVTNSTISNCTLEGANTTDPPTYPDATLSGSPEGRAWLILGEGASNITIEDNFFKQPVGQAAVEFYGGRTTPPNNTDISIIWNSAQYCAGYSFDYDNATDSTISHNYSLDCSIGNENDSSSQTLSGVTVNDNYVTRDQYATGGGCVVFGSCASPGAVTFYCGIDDTGTDSADGCSASGNVIDGNGHAMYLVELPSGGTYSNNQCINGCQIYGQ
jgi:hypothetical protein